jgi:hypothetical protein
MQCTDQTERVSWLIMQRSTNIAPERLLRDDCTLGKLTPLPLRRLPPARLAAPRSAPHSCALRLRLATPPSCRAGSEAPLAPASSPACLVPPFAWRMARRPLVRRQHSRHRRHRSRWLCDTALACALALMLLLLFLQVLIGHTPHLAPAHRPASDQPSSDELSALEPCGKNFVDCWV